MIAKTTRPSVSGVTPPLRLMNRLDEVCKSPIVWITGPGGCGKTTLVSCYVDSVGCPCLWYQADEGDVDIANFFYFLGRAAKGLSPRSRIKLPLLTPEYALGISAFANHFFEKLFRRLPRPTMLVIDDYHRLPSQALLHEVLRHGFVSVPKGISIIFVSRDSPPPILAGLFMTSRPAKIYGGELRFTIAETEEVLQRYTKEKLSPETTRYIYEKTLGWVALLVLLAEKGKRDGWNVANFTSESYGEIFDYFAGEIFSGLDARDREFLLQTSLVPKMTAAMAGELTGRHCPETVLERLHRSNFFTERHIESDVVYQYHPLFREFLYARARESINREVWLEHLARAAAILEKAGQIENAAVLYVQAGEHSGLLGLISANAETFLSQGRHHLVREWLDGLPDGVVAADPCLLYWRGVCLQPFQPAEARHCLERSFFLLKKGDNPFIWLVWSAVVDSIRCEWNDFEPLDQWISLFDKLLESASSAITAEIEGKVATSLAAALIIRQPQHQDLGDWLALSLACARKSRDSNFRILSYSYAVIYYYWSGDFHQGQVVFDEIRHFADEASAPPMIKLAWAWLEACMDTWLAADYDEAEKTVEKSLAYGNRHGVYVWHHMLLAVGTYTCLAKGDTARASMYLKQLSVILDGTRRHMYCQYHYLLSWLHLLKKEHSEALAHAEESCRVAEETGYVYPEILSRLALGRVLLARGEIDSALCLAEELFEASRRTKSLLFEYSSLLLRADAALAGGKEDEVVRNLRGALRLAAREGYSSPPWWWDTPSMTRLYIKAMEYGIEPDFVTASIRQRRLIPQNPPLHLEDWPWQVKIFTLGSFELVLNGIPFYSSGKPQHKPLALLKMLIALGGRKIDEDKLAVALWPDADGDMQHQTIKTTLYRLRRLLGHNEIILLHNGQLTLNPCFCWVDAWAYERRLDRAEALWSKNSDLDTAAQNTCLALQLYKGSFLDHTVDDFWSITVRERLRDKFLRGVRRLGRYYESRGQLAEAVNIYQRGIEVDPLVEEYYQLKMLCLGSAGRRAEAMNVYDRCCVVLGSAYGVEPSTATRKIRQAL